MKAIITGMNGTVAPVLYEELLKHDMDVIIWDRNKVSTDSEDAVYDFIKEVNPDLFFHIATGPVKWVEYIAKATEKLSVKLLFTSSVSVFSENGTGPYDITSVPNAEEDYGLY
ncbi:MAG TPA: NAD-dependent epimerase/dehydratase family protein, partial [Bacteroidales bacterium]|nr:NAD-dependent epimerase/dehydratase family protein [Bacteroidales bacterium]